MAWTTSDITLPSFSSTEVQLLYHIARNLEGNPTVINLSDITAKPCWPVTTILLWIIAHNVNGTSSGFTLTDISEDPAWSSEVQLLYIIANNLEGNTISLTLPAVNLRSCWPSARRLLHIIAQDGDTSPVNISEFTENECWTPYTQLLYLIARDGLRAITMEDLVLYYQVKSAETIATRIRDYSPEGNTGSLYSGVVLAFDGSNDNATVNHGGSLNSVLNGAHTVTFTVWIDSFAAQRFILQQGEYAVKYNNVTGTPVLEVFAAGVQARYTVGSISGQYVSVMIVVPDSGTPTVFINNVEVPSEVTGSSLDIAGTTLYIGSHSSSINFHSGRLSNLRIYSTEFTATEREELYNNPETLLPGSTTASQVKLMLLITERAGTILYDGSGNGFNASLNGPTWQLSQPSPVLQTALISWNRIMNSVHDSQNLNSANWNKNRINVSTSQADSDGGSSAFKLIATSSSGLHEFDQVTAGSISAGNKYFTAKAKADGYNYLALMDLNSTGFPYVIFNLGAGTVGTSSGATGSIIALGGGFYQLKVTINSIATTARLRMYVCNADSLSSFAGDNVSGVVVYQPSISNHDDGLYLPTSAAAVGSRVLLPEGLTSSKDVLQYNTISLPRPAGFNLEGNSYIEVPDDVSLDGSSKFSVSCWVYRAANADSNTILVKHSAYSEPARAYFIKNETSFRFSFRVYDGSGGNKEILTTGTSSAGWHHLAGVFDGDAGTIKIYLDGVLNNSDTTTITAIPNSTAPIHIGQMVGVFSSYLAAYPALYKSKALTDAEVLKNYNAHKSIFGL